MSVTAVTERPAQRTPNGGGVAARRAVIRWAMRLLRREWRQQLLILALITVAVGATVVASAVATDTPAPVAGVLGTAQDAATLSGPPARINAEIKDLESRYGRVDVIENESVPVPGTQNTFDLRAQDPRGPFGGPLLSLVSGRYPANPNQIAVTSAVAADFKLSIGSSWTLGGVTRKVVGIVENPQSLLDEFALVVPGQVTRPDNVTVLFDAPGVSASSLSTGGVSVTTAQTVANTNTINPETISIAAAVLGMLLIALVGIGGFTVLAQRRLRAIGMLAAQGATERNIRLVVRANGAATGVVGAALGLRAVGEPGEEAEDRARDGAHDTGRGAVSPDDEADVPLGRALGGEHADRPQPALREDGETADAYERDEQHAKHGCGDGDRLGVDLVGVGDRLRGRHVHGLGAKAGRACARGVE